MPGMDGIEAATRMRERHADVLVVLISIEESAAIGPAVEASGAAALVRKQEFSPAMLRRLWSDLQHAGRVSRGDRDGPHDRGALTRARADSQLASHGLHAIAHVRET